MRTPVKAKLVFWAYDLAFHTTANGQQLKCMTVIDKYTREYLAINDAGFIRFKP